MDSIFITAAWQTIENNPVNIIILIGILLIMAKASKNTIVICFAMFYAAYIVADYSMTLIEIIVPEAYIDEYQRTWHILLGIVGALIMLFLLLDMTISELSNGMRFCVVLTSIYIMLFYVVPNVGFAGFSSQPYDDIYNQYGKVGPLFDIALIALSLRKERGNECDRMAYNG